MQYGMFYMRRCERSGGRIGCSRHFPIHQTAHTDAYKTLQNVYVTVPEVGPKSFEKCRRQHKLKLNVI